MLLVQYTYPFDPNGTATTNKVVGERHTITPVNGPDFRFIVPRAAPFFKSSLQLLHVATNTPLLEGIHWAAGHKFDRASNTAPFLAVYGSILILDNTIEGVIELTRYQTLGGEFTINETLALELLANAQLDPRLAKWDNVLNTPTTYDPLLHRHHASESTGYEDFTATLNRLADAIIANLGQSSIDQVARSHIANMNNPHNTTLAQLPDAQHLLALTPTVVTGIVELIDDGGTEPPTGSTKPTRAQTQLVDGDYFIPQNDSAVVYHDAPLAPADLATIEWIAGPVSFATNKLVIRNTDKPIMGLNEPLEITSDGVGGKLVYFESLGYWKVYLTSQASAAPGSGGTPGNGGTPSNVINQLTITSPTNEQAGVQATFGLTSSGFTTTPAIADTLLRYEWQIAADTAFANLLWVGTSLVNSVMPGATIPSGTRVYVRVRGIGGIYGAGAWSMPVTFVVAAIAGPSSVTIAGTTLASGGRTHQFTVQSAAYSGPSTHTATQVQVLTTSGTVVYDSGELAGAIVSHVPFDNNFRPTNLTDYIARVRYKLATGQWTDYTTTSVRTGNGAFTSVSTSFQTGSVTSWTYNALTAWYAPGGSVDPYGVAGPYYVCSASDGTVGISEQWLCDPANPTAGAPITYLNNQGFLGAPSVGGPYPRTGQVTQRITTFNTQFSTSRNTQKWTEW